MTPLELEILQVINQIPGAVEKAFAAFIERHPGHGNQKTHGNRFGAGQAKESLRRLKDDKGARESYKQQHRERGVSGEVKTYDTSDIKHDLALLKSGKFPQPDTDPLVQEFRRELARRKVNERGKENRPKLASGLSYGKDIDISGLKVGHTVHVQGNERRGTISGVVTKIKPKNVDYEANYMGRPMTLTTSKEELRGGYAASGKKVHKIK